MKRSKAGAQSNADANAGCGKEEQPAKPVKQPKPEVKIEGGETGDEDKRVRLGR